MGRGIESRKLRLLNEKDRLWAKILNCKYKWNGNGGNKVDIFSSLWSRDVQTMGTGVGALSRSDLRTSYLERYPMERTPSFGRIIGLWKEG